MTTLSILPFHAITNVELYNTLETTERQVKNNLANQNFTKHVLDCTPNTILNPPCDYYTTEEFRSKHTHTQSKRQTRILHLNIHSLDKHWGELVAALDALENMDFIALSEIGTKNIENREAMILKYGYNFQYKKPRRAKGGVGLMYKSNISMDAREDLAIESKQISGHELEIENIWFETCLNTQPNKKLVIGVIYRHPGGTIECLNHFTSQVETTLQKINDERKMCIILGDLNIDGLKINLNDNVKNFFDTVLEQNFIPTITVPTRITTDTATAIDHIIVNEQLIKNTKSLDAGNIYCDISDHLPNFLIINNDEEPTKNRPYVRIYGEKNMMKFRNKIHNADWGELFSTDDVEHAMDMFYKTYYNAFYTSFPQKRLSRKRAKDRKWMTSALRKSTDHKNKLYKKTKLRPTDNNKRKYKQYRNILTSCLRTAEETYYTNLIQEGKNNLKQLWTTVGDIINPSKLRRTNKINKLTMNNRILENDEDIANAMNNHFSQIGATLAAKLPNNGYHQRYMKKRITPSFFLEPVNNEETIKEIAKLNNKKSAGDDNIKPRVLKENKETLAKPITHIINLSFKNGEVPNKLKIAKVIPIYKKNDKADPNNYRPISLLSIINKIMEKLIAKRVLKFLNEHEILYEYQFGFRENYSTTLAITEIVENLLTELQNGKLVAGIYLDLSKAFDTVDHNILLDKLEHYGIRGNPLKWFKSYLQNRQQYTVVNGKKSNLQHVQYGVPQGSVLGPLLFLLYTNDIVMAVGKNKLRLFADDSNVFVTADNATTLQQKMKEVLLSIFIWFKANKLTANINKTAYSIFKRNGVIPGCLNSIKIDNEVINRVKEVKYLGIILDDKLNWEAHINELNKSLTKTINAFKIIKNFVPNQNKSALYYAYVYSKIQYGIEVYSSAKDKWINKTQIKQNRALKVLFNKDFFTPTQKLHKDLDLLLVKDIGKLNTLKFVHRQRNNKTPSIFDNYFYWEQGQTQTQHKTNTQPAHQETERQLW